MSKIQSLQAREIIDSRGNPTIEVVCELVGGFVGVAAVPSGMSTGVHEALELRDHDPKRYNGQGVLTAVRHVTGEIAQSVSGKDYDQETLDRALIDLDGTPNKSRLGANALLGVSLAFARAVAQQKGIPLYEHLAGLVGAHSWTVPQPMFNVINGGKHADSGLDIQEYMLVPVVFATFHEKVRVVAEIILSLKKILIAKGYAVSVGDEGGFAPKLSSNEEAFELLVEAITRAGYTTDAVKIGIDAAASSFFHDGVYVIKIKGVETSMTSTEIINWYQTLVETYPIISIEDGLAEEDWNGFALMTETMGERIKIIGDDLLVTNVTRIATAIEKHAVNAVLIKPNQIGTLSETIHAITLTKQQGWTPVVSHRSGETTDTFIADLAAGLSCEYIKSGSLVRGERVCKYNRLMHIEDTLLSA